MATKRTDGRGNGNSKILKGVRLTKRQRRTIEAVVNGDDTGLSERDRHAVLVQIVTACTRAGAEMDLLDILGLDLISNACALVACRDKATRAGGRDKDGSSQEVADFTTRQAAVRTALEWRRKIGAGLRVKRGDVDTARPPAIVRRGRAAAVLSAAPDIQADSVPDTLPAS